MNAVRRSEGLLAAAGFAALLDLASQGVRSSDEIAAIVAARGSGAANRVRNSLLLMQEMGLLEVTTRGLFITPGGHAVGGGRAAMRTALASHYCARLEAAPFGSLFQRDPDANTILVDRVLLPHRDIGLPYLLADFGIFDRTGDRAWTVAEDMTAHFLDLLGIVNARATRSKPMTPAELEKWIANRRAAGEVAEAFAVMFEQRRLAGHPMLGEVRWTASEDVGAGFDIHTFDDQRSLALDRFVEVKGHAGDRSFHWSSGEIEAARQKRQRYWLYLVDRRRVDEPDYVPEMYSDPHAFFIEENPAGWLSEPSSFKFRAPDSRAL